MNGSTQQQYEYDDLYRLTKAYGELNSSKGDASYSLTMEYDLTGNIIRKKLGHHVFDSNPAESNYDLDYTYRTDKPHALAEVKQKMTTTVDQTRHYTYNYDSNGNMTGYNWPEHYRSLTWDEENQLMGVNDEGYVSRYVYDDTGERVLKSFGGVTQVSVNGTSMGTMEDMKNYTGYLSPYFVFKEGSFTKHIYAGTERIVSQIGNGEFNNNSGGLGGNGITAGSLNFAQVQDWYEVQKEKYIASLGVPPGPPDKKGIYASPQYTGKPWPDFGSPLNSSLNTPPKGWPKMPVFNPPGGPPGPPVQFGSAQTNDSVNGGYGYSGTGTFEEDRYFYHHDHLGSSSYLTNQLGNITQHVEYIPFGEVFVEERNDKWNTPYLFNGKELDEETGLCYYGARYYDSKMSLFLSVDPLVESTMDPYGYCYQNPVKYIDPTGMEGEGTNDWFWDSKNKRFTYDASLTSKEQFEKLKAAGKIQGEYIGKGGNDEVREVKSGGNTIGKVRLLANGDWVDETSNDSKQWVYHTNNGNSTFTDVQGLNWGVKVYQNPWSISIDCEFAYLSGAGMEVGYFSGNYDGGFYLNKYLSVGYNIGPSVSINTYSQNNGPLLLSRNADNSLQGEYFNAGGAIPLGNLPIGIGVNTGGDITQPTGMDRYNPLKTQIGNNNSFKGVSVGKGGGFSIQAGFTRSLFY